ncbi:MAG: MFS transporter [Chloroflexi bacterium]|nr:MFS transporter [Chloroflexota bacterium]
MSRIWPLHPLRDLYDRGPDSLFNLSVYGAGFTGLWTAITSVILQFRVLAVAEPSQKILALSVITLAGLVFAAIVQPIAGGFSDRSQNRHGKRAPYIVAGGLGLAAATLLLGVADNFISLLFAFCLMQVLGNIAQGPANALLVDHVPAQRRGAAAGALTLARAIGAGIAVVGTLLLLGQHSTEEVSVWMWGALGLIASMALGSSIWTAATTRSRPSGEDNNGGNNDGGNNRDSRKNGVAAAEPGSGTAPEPARTKDRAPAPTSDFVWFLVAFTVATGTMSVLSRFALFYLQDVVGLINPARGALVLSISVGGGVALSVLPAGILSDRIGRFPLLLAGGIIGCAAVAALAIAESLPYLVMVGLVVGIASGVLLSVAWALANDLVRPSKAGRTLGYTSAAVLVGAAIPLTAGFVIEFLNRISDGLGYRVMILAVAVAFLLVPLMLIRSTRTVSRMANSSAGRHGTQRGSGP